MRHGTSGRNLSRPSSHRRLMLFNLAKSLIKHELIKTSLAKAKELRRVLEPLITLAKKDSVANRRLAFSKLRNQELVAKLFNNLGPKFRLRPGGYLRILRCGYRKGDNSLMAIIELVDRKIPNFADADADADADVDENNLSKSA